MLPNSLTERARLGSLIRDNAPAAQVEEVRRRMLVGQAARRIRQAVALLPPNVTVEERQALAALILRPNEAAGR